MRWRVETLQQRSERQSKWHVWFAWHPVSDNDGQWFWLERVLRHTHPLWTQNWEYKRLGPDTVGHTLIEQDFKTALSEVRELEIEVRSG